MLTSLPSSCATVSGACMPSKKTSIIILRVMNENYVQPSMPAGSEAGILRGAYHLRGAADDGRPRVQLMGSGAILREVVAAAELLESDFGVASDVWSATSFNELRRDGLAVERWNLLHPTDEPRVPYIASLLDGHAGPIVAASDYLKSFADGIRPFVGRRFRALGTDGYGRSDFRRKLRHFFEVDRRWIALAALASLADEGTLERSIVAGAIAAFGIDPSKADPVTV